MFVGSSYFSDVLAKIDVSEYLYEKLNHYNFSNYFSEEDIDWFIYIIRKKILGYDIKNIDVKENMNIWTHYINSKSDIPNNSGGNIIYIMMLLFDEDLSYFTKKDFIKLLSIRDKLYSLVKDSLDKEGDLYHNIIKYLDIENEIEEKEAEKGVKIITNVLIKKAYVWITKYIIEKADDINIELSSEIKDIKI